MGWVMVYDAMDGGWSAANAVRRVYLCHVFRHGCTSDGERAALVSGRYIGTSSDSLRLELRFETGIVREFAKRGARAKAQFCILK